MSDERLRQVETTLATLATEQRLTSKFMEKNFDELKAITKSNVGLISDVHIRTATIEDSNKKRAKWTLLSVTALLALWVELALDYFKHGGQ